MSESAILMPFICKWLGAHSKPQYFETQEKLRNHIDNHNINSCNKAFRGDPIYICPWEGCKKHQSDIIKLEGIKICQVLFGFASSTNTKLLLYLAEHLHKHTQQRPFKCPICNGLRFGSPDALNRHLIINHNDSIVDSTGTDDDTLYDENEKLNLDEIDVLAKEKASKDESAILIKGKDNQNESHTTKLSYHDVLVKGRVDENEDTKSFMSRRYDIWDLYCQGMEAISLLPDEPVVDYDLDNENYDDLPDAPQEELSEAEQDKLMWESFFEAHKGLKAVELFSKAFEMLESMKSGSYLQQKY
nr:112_t:CDS:2 [Entrophospora candida]